MLLTIATFALGALLTAFAVYAVMLNESERATRRRRRREPAASRSAAEVEPAADLDRMSAPSMLRDGRRLPVGDFLFGALFLRGAEPLTFAQLAGAASDAGLDINQTLEWLARAEESGLIERLEQRNRETSPAEPAVRLTEAGMDVARNNRRGAPKTVRTAS